ncbi:STAS domain-containing protein [Nocardioides sp. ChNu-99]|uniref:STAS domain-containing protein n=1 Tax=Nocardioides sp. ChNu-99 TaxID=2839897 RepID=UPI0024065141|nr:STAS domain-containing protein [Nocardioides sp. ChNu-99]MDF9716432.1 hypothetical protein [Nocardioides sp. ChNu-99]
MDQQERSLEIAFDRANATVGVRGVVDAPAAHNLREFVELVLRTGVRRLVVDLTEVEVLHTVGVRELDDGVRAARACGVVVEVRAPDGCVARRVLDLVDRTPR